MAFKVNGKDFRFFLSQAKALLESMADNGTVDMDGVLSDTYYSDPYDNGLPDVTIPLIAACHACDIAEFTYNKDRAAELLTDLISAWQNYFREFHGSTDA